MGKVSVLVVDDSVVVRKILSEAIASDPHLVVVGSAATGSIALQKIPQLNPDVVVLDVEMPDLDGVETVRRIRASWPRLPVLMCSSLTAHGADTTLRAIASGASDYVAKPSRLGPGGDGLASFRAELVAKVRALSAGVRASMPVLSASVPPPAVRLPRIEVGPQLVTTLAIGCSTGGPNALATLFRELPRDLPVPIFVVQHMPPLFTKMLADRLTASSGVAVCEARDGEVVENGRAYIAPGDHHMTVVRDGGRTRIVLNQDAPECSCRPAVDVLFRSLAKTYRSGVLAAVLTGMGQDGTRGARAVVEAGGRVIVQDPASCVVPSMPRFVVAAGLSDGTFEVDRLGRELVRRVRGNTTLRPTRLEL